MELVEKINNDVIKIKDVSDYDALVLRTIDWEYLKNCDDESEIWMYDPNKLLRQE